MSFKNENDLPVTESVTLIPASEHVIAELEQNKTLHDHKEDSDSDEIDFNSDSSGSKSLQTIHPESGSVSEASFSSTEKDEEPETITTNFDAANLTQEDIDQFKKSVQDAESVYRRVVPTRDQVIREDSPKHVENPMLLYKIDLDDLFVGWCYVNKFTCRERKHENGIVKFYSRRAGLRQDRRKKRRKSVLPENYQEE